MDDKIDSELDPGVFEQDGELPGCPACGVCCHNHSVLITHHDVLRILLHSEEIPVEEFIIFYEPNEEYMDNEKLDEYPVIMIEDSPCYLALRFVQETPGGDRVCVFLGDDEKTCLIHPFKPLTCRAYPFVIIDGKITRLERIRCKEPWHPAGHPPFQELASLLKRAYREFDEFTEMIRSWNENHSSASFNEFFKAFFEAFLSRGRYFHSEVKRNG